MHRTNRMKQSWSIHFPHQLMCRYQGLGCIESWLDYIVKREKLSSWKVCFHFLISSFGSVQEESNSYERQRSIWEEGAGGGGCWGDIQHMSGEIIIGTNTSVLLCSETSDTASPERQIGAGSQSEAGIRGITANQRAANCIRR